MARNIIEERRERKSNARLAVCSECGRDIFNFRVELPPPFGLRFWWHEDEVIDEKHVAVPKRGRASE